MFTVSHKIFALIQPCRFILGEASNPALFLLLFSVYETGTRALLSHSQCKHNFYWVQTVPIPTWNRAWITLWVYSLFAGFL